MTTATLSPIPTIEELEAQAVQHANAASAFAAKADETDGLAASVAHSLAVKEQLAAQAAERQADEAKLNALADLASTLSRDASNRIIIQDAVRSYECFWEGIPAALHDLPLWHAAAVRSIGGTKPSAIELKDIRMTSGVFGIVDEITDELITIKMDNGKTVSYPTFRHTAVFTGAQPCVAVGDRVKPSDTIVISSIENAQVIIRKGGPLLILGVKAGDKVSVIGKGKHGYFQLCHEGWAWPALVRFAPFTRGLDKIGQLLNKSELSMPNAEEYMTFLDQWRGASPGCAKRESNVAAVGFVVRQQNAARGVSLLPKQASESIELAADTKFGPLPSAKERVAWRHVNGKKRHG